MLKGPLAKQGYDWWWHSLTAYNKETGEPRPFFIEYFVCNPDLLKMNLPQVKTLKTLKQAKDLLTAC